MKNEQTNLQIEIQFESKSLRNINFFTFSDRIPLGVLSQYNMIRQDFIEGKIMEGSDANDYEYPEIYNLFLSHMMDDDPCFYFFILRPYIIKNHQDRLCLNDSCPSIKKILKTNLQPTLFQNLVTLALNGQRLDNFEWITFLRMPKIRTLEINQNQITNLKPLAKCSWSELRQFDMQGNNFTLDELRHSYKARYLRRPLSIKQQLVFKCQTQKEQTFHLTGFKFKENIGKLSLSSLNPQLVKDRMEEKFKSQKKPMEQTQQSVVSQLQTQNPETKVEEIMSENNNQTQPLKQSDVVQLITKQDRVCNDEKQI